MHESITVGETRRCFLSSPPATVITGLSLLACVLSRACCGVAYVPTIPNATMPAVTFWGGTPELERLPATHPELGWLTSEVVAAGIAPRSKHISEWCLLRKRRVLEVLVLGASVTAGCGAHAPSPHCHPSG